MNEVIPGIYRLPIPIPETSLGHINVYMVQGNDGYLMVDTGWDTGEAFDSLKSQMKELGVDFKDISQILVTHIHPDHYGLVGKLKKFSAARFYLHSLEKDLIESRYIHMDRLIQQTAQWLHINGVPSEYLSNLQTASVRAAGFVTTTYPDVTLQGEETISTGLFTFQVLWTPGHSPGHICLYEPTKKILLSGDHILPNITPNIGLHPQSGDNPLGHFINSLKATKQLDIALVLPGHETPFNNVSSRIEQLFQHHKTRNSEILTTIKAEAKTAYQIAKAIIWLAAIGGVGLQDLPPLHQRLAMLETLSHLEAMRFKGRLDKFSREGIIYYQQT